MRGKEAKRQYRARGARTISQVRGQKVLDGANNMLDKLTVIHVRLVRCTVSMHMYILTQTFTAAMIVPINLKIK